MKPLTVDDLVAEFGEQWRPLIVGFVAFLDGMERDHAALLDGPFDRRGAVAELLSRTTPPRGDSCS